MLEDLKGEIFSHVQNLESATTRSINETESWENQVNECAVIVNNFVNQTIQAVNEIEDPAETSEILLNSLIQINNFMAQRVPNVKSKIMQDEAKLEVYESVKANIAKVFEDHHQRQIAEKDKTEKIKNDLDSDGKYTKRRKIGEKPEKLRDIRKIQAEMSSGNIEPEDI